MDAPLIDVVIPNRNKAEFLPRTLASLQAQTESRWRAIVVDGDSTDGSAEILRAIAQQDPRFEILTARPASLTGLSLYRSWNHGLLQVRAPFFAILTSDDLWEPSWLHSAVAGLEANPGAVAAVARAIVVDAHDNVGEPTPACRQFEASLSLTPGQPNVLSSRACVLRALLFGPIFSTIHAMVFRSRLLADGVLFAEDLGYIGDVEYYLHASLRGSVVYDMSHRALFRTYDAQESSAVQGRIISDLWRKETWRNRKLVAAQLGIPSADLEQATNEILSRHRFMMLKPNRATLRRSKFQALWQMVWACCRFPRLAVAYFRARADIDRFLFSPAVALAHQLSDKYGLT